MVSEKTMKSVVIVLGLLLVAGFAVVVGAIVFQIGGEEPAPAPEVAGAGAIGIPDIAGGTIMLPPGATVEGVTGNERVLVVHLKARGGVERVVVFDRKSGEILGDVEFVPE